MEAMTVRVRSITLNVVAGTVAAIVTAASRERCAIRVAALMISSVNIISSDFS